MSYTAEERERIMAEAHAHIESAKDMPRPDVLADLPGVVAKQSLAAPRFTTTMMPAEAEPEPDADLQLVNSESLSVERVREFDQVVVGAIAAEVQAALDEHKEFVSAMLTDIVGELLARQGEVVNALRTEIETLKADVVIQKSITAQLSADVAAAELVIRGGCAQTGAALSQ